MSDDCSLMDLHPSHTFDINAPFCDGQCEICIYYKKERIRKYKCRICGIEHFRGKLFKEHFKYRAGHKQTRRGPYKK